MIALNIVEGDHKGHAGHLLGYAVEADSENFRTVHWALLLLMDDKPRLVAAEIGHIEVILPENLVGSP